MQVAAAQEDGNEDGYEAPQVGLEEVHEIPYVDMDEEVVDMDVAAKGRDPLFRTRIVRVIDGATFSGVVADIHQGVRSGTLLYYIQYGDGDVEHLVGEEVARFLEGGHA